MQRLPITVQSQSTRLAAVRPLTLGKPGDFLCPALAARGWAWRAPPGRRERVTNELTAQSQSVRCRAVFFLAEEYAHR